MRRVIDLECVLPPDENGVARQYFGAAGHRIGEGDPELLPPLPGYGFENYRNIFTRREGDARQPDAAKPAGKSLALLLWLPLLWPQRGVPDRGGPRWCD